jgi:MSHA biogenesis protein MshO
MQQRGFTLLEVITVVVILSIVSTIGGRFMISTIQSYNQTQTRSKLVNTSRQAIERMTRQLRGALPYSATLVNGGQCLKFLPVAGGGNYIDDVPDSVNGAAASGANPNPLVTADHLVDFGSARYVALGALGAAELYGAGPVSLAALAGRTATSLTLANDKVWQRNSINRRFYLLDNPQAFCVSSGELRFYQNLVVTAEDIPALVGACAGADCSVLANNVSGAANYTLAGGTEDRNTKLTLGLSFVLGGETVSFNQEVLIRNVP